MVIRREEAQRGEDDVPLEKEGHYFVEFFNWSREFAQVPHTELLPYASYCCRELNAISQMRGGLRGAIDEANLHIGFCNGKIMKSSSKLVTSPALASASTLDKSPMKVRLRVRPADQRKPSIWRKRKHNTSKSRATDTLSPGGELSSVLVSTPVNGCDNASTVQEACKRTALGSERRSKKCKLSPAQPPTSTQAVKNTSQGQEDLNLSLGTPEPLSDVIDLYHGSPSGTPASPLSFREGNYVSREFDDQNNSGHRRTPIQCTAGREYNETTRTPQMLKESQTYKSLQKKPCTAVIPRKAGSRIAAAEITIQGLRQTIGALEADVKESKSIAQAMVTKNEQLLMDVRNKDSRIVDAEATIQSLWHKVGAFEADMKKRKSKMATMATENEQFLVHVRNQDKQLQNAESITDVLRQKIGALEADAKRSKSNAQAMAPAKKQLLMDVRKKDNQLQTARAIIDDLRQKISRWEADSKQYKLISDRMAAVGLEMVQHVNGMEARRGN